jgi:hypothetical protein
MQKKYSIYNTLILFLGFIVLGGLIVFSSIIFSDSTSKNLEYIPIEAIFKMRINGKALVGKTFTSIAFENQDSEFLRQLDTLVQQNIKDTTKKEKSGINFLSEIGAFGVEKNGQISVGFILNIKNKENFIKNMKLMGNSNYVINNDDVAIIGIANNSSFDKKTFQSFLTKKTTNNFTDNDFQNDLTICFKQSKKPTFQTGTGKINLNFDGDKIAFEGKIKSNQPFTPTKYSISKKGFHYMVQDPKSLNQLNTFLRMIDPLWGNLTHIEFDYRGVALKEGGNPYYADPDLDILLSFENEMEFDSLLTKLNFLKDVGIKYEKGELFAGKSKYSIKNIDKKHLFLGKSSSSFLEKSNPNLMEISGSPEVLTNIKGPDYITSFFDVMTPFAATKTYFSSIEKTTITMSKTDVKGEVKFKKGKNSFIEIVRFMLILKGIQ